MSMSMMSSSQTQTASVPLEGKRSSASRRFTFKRVSEWSSEVRAVFARKRKDVSVSMVPTFSISLLQRSIRKGYEDFLLSLMMLEEDRSREEDRSLEEDDTLAEIGSSILDEDLSSLSASTLGPRRTASDYKISYRTPSQQTTNIDISKYGPSRTSMEYFKKARISRVEPTLCHKIPSDAYIRYLPPRDCIIEETSRIQKSYSEPNVHQERHLEHCNYKSDCLVKYSLYGKNEQDKVKFLRTSSDACIKYIVRAPMKPPRAIYTRTAVSAPYIPERSTHEAELLQPIDSSSSDAQHPDVLETGTETNDYKKQKKASFFECFTCCFCGPCRK